MTNGPQVSASHPTDSANEPKSEIEDYVPANTTQIPWYLRKVPAAGDSPFNTELPDIPDDAPKELSSVLRYMADDLGLTDIQIFDMRQLKSPTAFGEDAMMVISSTRGERHLLRAAESLRKFMKESFRAKVKTEGMVAPERIKIRERRIKKKLSKFSGDMAMAEQELRSEQAHTWVLINSGIRGINIHLMTRDRREELDLETLWTSELPMINDMLGSQLKDNLVDRKKDFSGFTRRRRTDPLERYDAITQEYQKIVYRARKQERSTDIGSGNDRKVYVTAEKSSPFYSFSKATTTGTRGYHTEAIVESTGTSQPILDKFTIEVSRTAYSYKREFSPLKDEIQDLLALYEFDTVVEGPEAKHLYKKLQSLAEHGEYSVVEKMVKHLPKKFVYDSNHDIHTLLMDAHIYHIIRCSSILDLQALFTQIDRRTPAFICSFLRAFPWKDPEHKHWRKKLEFLQLAHMVNPKVTSVVALKDHLIQQQLHGSEPSKDDVLLVLATVAVSPQFSDKDSKDVIDQKRWLQATNKSFAAITDIIRLMIKDDNFNLIHSPELYTILYQACVQRRFDIGNVLRDPFPKYSRHAGLLLKSKIPMDADRATMIDLFMNRYKVPINSTYWVLSLSSLAHAGKWSLFWKKWNEIYLAGVYRDSWMWALVASLVAKAGDTIQMEYLLSKEWADFGNQHPMTPPTKEFIMAMNVCLRVVDPDKEKYEQLRDSLQRYRFGLSNNSQM
ncbi:uncharacterized protein V1510DRAFT_368016 [Dipodascopsis tothii]|uniref:uncharacterized protein n=1 Tax=Dipodascopsis tothii TaxID=44089 RepID=UPI0034CFC017